MIKLNKKNVALSLSAFVVTIAAIGGMVGVNAASNNSNIKNALVAGNYDAFKTELANSISKEKFDEMSKNAQEHQKVEDAIAKKDYNAFKEAANSKLLTKITTEEDFNKLAENKASMLAIDTKIDEAVKANNFDNFKAAMEEKKSVMTSNSQGFGKLPRKMNVNLSDEQLKTRFDEIVAKYKADGSLPSDKRAMKGMFGNGGSKRGGMMHEGKRGGLGI